jgi:hypothetical protein
MCHLVRSDDASLPRISEITKDKALIANIIKEKVLWSAGMTMMGPPNLLGRP